MPKTKRGSPSTFRALYSRDWWKKQPCHREASKARLEVASRAYCVSSAGRDYPFSSLQVNFNYAAIKHVDGNNIGELSLGTLIGSWRDEYTVLRLGGVETDDALYRARGERERETESSLVLLYFPTRVGPSYIQSIGSHSGGKLWTQDEGDLDC